MKKTSLMPIIFSLSFLVLLSSTVLASERPGSVDRAKANSEKMIKNSEERKLLLEQKRQSLEMAKQDRQKAFEEKMQDVEKLKQEKQTMVQERKGEVTQRRCENVTRGVDNRISAFNRNKDVHISNYNRLKERMEEFIERLKAAGYDVTDFESHMVELDNKVVDYAAEVVVLVNMLENSKEASCGDGSGEFMSYMQDARDQLQVVHQKRQEIKTYYALVIRQDIARLRLPDGSNLEPAEGEENETEEVENEQEGSKDE